MDVKNRAIFNSYFYNYFKFESENAFRIRRVLLFIYRFYSAVSIFTEIVQRIFSFREILFISLKLFINIFYLFNSNLNKIVINILTVLNILTLRRIIRKYFSGAEDAKSAINLKFDNIR
jgi:hypothetical protein